MRIIGYEVSLVNVALVATALILMAKVTGFDIAHLLGSSKASERGKRVQTNESNLSDASPDSDRMKKALRYVPKGRI